MLNMDSIYQEYAELVYKFLLSLCHEPETAEELTQETFYQAVRSSGRFDGTCKVSTWLCQIAKHLWYRELDRRRRRGTESLEVELETRDFVSKEVVLLRITGAFSFREIGELFGRNETWARVTFYRAKQKIVKGWEEYEM